MGGAAGLVGRRAQTASGIVFARDFIDETNFLAFAPTLGAKAKIYVSKSQWLMSQAIIRSTNQ